MSSVPTGTFAFSMRATILPSRSAIGTPRRRIPTNPSASTPPFFSTISYANLTLIRKISDADINWAFWRRAILREGFLAFIVGCASSLRWSFVELGLSLYSTLLVRVKQSVASACFRRTLSDPGGNQEFSGPRLAPRHALPHFDCSCVGGSRFSRSELSCYAHFEAPANRKPRSAPPLPRVEHRRPDFFPMPWRGKEPSLPVQSLPPRKWPRTHHGSMGKVSSRSSKFFVPRSRARGRMAARPILRECGCKRREFLRGLRNAS